MAFCCESTRKIFALIVLNGFILSTSAQDSSQKRLSINLNFEMSGMQIFEASNAPVRMPPNIYYRRSNYINNPAGFRNITDNPIKHGAYYACIRTTTSVLSLFKMNIDLYGEHRGVSYGIFNTGNMIVYPVMSATVRDSFKLFRKFILAEGKAGSFLDEQLDERLIIYNIDVQGLQAGVRVGKWRMRYSLYADLYNGIGLNIDDFHGAALERVFGKDNHMAAGVSFNIIAPPFAKKSNNQVWSIFSKRSHRNGDLYIQLGYRNRDKSNVNFTRGFKEQLGVVASARFTKEWRKFDYNSRLEARFYGKSFNSNHFSEGLRYRKPPTQQPLYANTIGEYLYPLRKFNSPFSQWGVFTEYQGSNVGGISLTGNVRYNILRRAELNLQYDLNQILARNDTALMSRSTNNFLYPFFNVGFFYKPIENLRLGLIVTNKGMNLDISYPGLYLYKTPYVGISLSMTSKTDHGR